MTDLQKIKEEVIDIFFKLTDDNSRWYKGSINDKEIFSNGDEEYYFNIDLNFKLMSVYVKINGGYHHLFRFGHFGFITDKRMREIIRRLKSSCDQALINTSELSNTKLFDKVVKEYKTKADIRDEKIDNVLK